MSAKIAARDIVEVNLCNVCYPNTFFGFFFTVVLQKESISGYFKVECNLFERHLCFLLGSGLSWPSREDGESEECFIYLFQSLLLIYLSFRF